MDCRGLACFGLGVSLVLALGLGLAAVDASAAAAPSVPRVGKHKVLELVFTAAGTPANPFDDYLLKLEVTDPAGRIFTVDGFYDGDGKGGQTGRTWKVRLCPYRTGDWAWRTVAGDAPDSGLAGLSGQFDCVDSGDLGGLVAQGRYFRLQDGDFFFPVGNFLDAAGGLPLWSYLGETVSDAQRDARIRGKMWAALCAGAAGTGTGTDLKAFQRLLAQSRIPFHRMEPSNGLVQGGGSSRFCLAEIGHHYLVYSTTGSFTLSVTGAGLTGRWFSPRDPHSSFGTPYCVSSGTSTFTPPDITWDWTLWVSDDSNLNSHVTHISTEATVLQVVAGGAGPR